MSRLIWLPLLCAAPTALLCVNALPQQHPLATLESLNLPLVVWHGLGDK